MRLPKMIRGLIWLLAITSLASAVAQAQAADKPIDVRLAWSPSASSFHSIAVARDQGYFKQAGLNVDLVELRSGPEYITAMLSGSVDFSAAVSDKPLVLRERGQGAKNIVALTNTTPTALVVRSDLGIKEFKPATMKGLKFGVTGLGSATETELRLLLLGIGVDPKDVTILGIGTASLLAALESKQVDAIMAPEPMISIARAHKTGDAIVDMRRHQGDPRSGAFFLAIQAGDDFLAKNPEGALRMVRAILAADEEIARDSPQSFATYAKAFKNVPEDVTRSAYDVDRLTFRPEITEEMVTNMIAADTFSGDVKQPHQFADAVWTPAVSLWSKSK